MTEQYSINEILSAVEELQKINKKKDNQKVRQKEIRNKSNIPNNTLELIKEAENFKKNKNF